MKKLILATALVTLFATPVLAQDAPAEDAPLTDEDVLTVAIGCIATYDTVVAQGKAGGDAASIATARKMAVDVYKEFSGESDEEVASDIAESAKIFPEMLKTADVTLEEFRETCDAIFTDEEEDAPTA